MNRNGRAVVGVSLYPWDAVGDPDCAARIRSLGAGQVSLAAAYHTVRALTPHHPRHKVVTAAHSAVYYRPDPDRWEESGTPLRPAAAAWAEDSFGPAARALGDAGLDVLAWVILAHNQRLGTLHPSAAVVNAYGDTYPWALCVARPEVRRYCAALAAEAAAQPGLSGLELESCGWYGFDHLHAHDKTAGLPPAPLARLLLSLCFCRHCADAYRATGLDARELRRLVREELDAVLAGTAEDGRLPSDVLAAVSRMRTDTAGRLRGEVLAAVHAERPGLPVLLHTQPDPLALGANPGVAPSELHDTAAGPVLPFRNRSAEALDAVRAYAGRDRRVVAGVAAVSGLGADLPDLGSWCADLLAAGATELRLYHAGLASPQDLAAVRTAVAALAG
ncbi:hypothetical protein [Streptacidiphilus rugosus]|uniref:hypothetical protein n=1 Tax=Streptacidiphilus rugosus TaxID=405783 RepID=UPI00069147F6|nr:hypothetical protein [Streptacidiphilus rugosus]